MSNSSNQVIRLRGATTHNLDAVDLDLPLGSWLCIAGVSGSGKTSLALDTLYAEGRRRYLATLSNRARQLMGSLEGGTFESLEGLPPAVAVSQHSVHRNARSTVGTLTGIADLLRLLFAQHGQAHCLACRRPLEPEREQDLVARLVDRFFSRSVVVLAPLVDGHLGSLAPQLARVRDLGFAEIRLNDAYHPLSNPPEIDSRRRHRLDVVIARRPAESDDLAGFSTQLTEALRIGKGVLRVVDGEEEYRFDLQRVCPGCGSGFPEQIGRASCRERV